MQGAYGTPRRAMYKYFNSFFLEMVLIGTENTDHPTDYQMD